MPSYAEAIADVIYKFLQSRWQFFCQRIAKANWKIQNLPQHFIIEALSTWISKGES